MIKIALRTSVFLDPGSVIWYHRCRIVPDGTINCAGAGGILCVNNNYVTVSQNIRVISIVCLIA